MSGPNASSVAAQQTAVGPAGWTIEQLSSGGVAVCDAEISIDAVYDRVEKAASSRR
ncbi:MAG: hypothetical protein JST00_22400 [Deltaproteobacteria bacterium]|nr:hypothetical protein [Deltaproteobacteria bacterium]